VIGLPHRLVQRTLTRKGPFYERNQYCFWLVYRALDDPDGPLDSQTETADRRGSITKDVPIVRIDHLTIKAELLGVWQALYSGGALDFKEVI
jgi:hypothetical protein